MILLAGCFPWTGEADSVFCDARTLEPGEARARQVPCTDELPDDSDARAGDWVLENAVARFFFRAADGPLTELLGDGGTLIDAFLVDEDDLLLEMLPDVDRSSLTAVNEDGSASIVMPGMTWTLTADSDVLHFDADVLLKPMPGDDRVGATFRDRGSFLGVDGTVEELGGAVRVSGATMLALSPESRWPAGQQVRAYSNATQVRMDVDGAPVDRLWVDEGFIDSWGPAGAALVSETDGCLPDSLLSLRCGSLRVRVEDDASDQLRAEVTDGDWEEDMPVGGWSVPVTPTERELWVWAGPAFAAESVDWPAQAEVDALLPRSIDTDGVVLMAPAVEVGPDLDEGRSSAQIVRTLVGEGVDYVVVLADDEVPDGGTYGHDPVLTVAGSRAAGMVWSWPWSETGKRPGHGAVPWQGLRALDILALSEGGQGLGRLTVVTTEWVMLALDEAPASTWDPRPDAVYLEGLDDLPVLLDLYRAWFDVAPLGPRTWVGYTGAKNNTAVDAGIVRGDTSAGTGPRIQLSKVARRPGEVHVQVQAPDWMGIHTVTLWSDTDSRVLSLGSDGEAWVEAGAASFVVVTVEGAREKPWGGGPAWGVSAPLWLRSPAGTPM